MEESALASCVDTGDQSMQLLTLSHAYGDQRAGAGEQNGSSEAKKQSSSSQAETNLLEEQQRSLTRNSSDQLEIPSGGPSGGLKKSSSSGSIPCSNSQRQQSRSVRKTISRFDEVQERRRQLEEKRQEALKKQISEKEKRRQRALELKGSKQPSARVASKKVIEVPPIFVETASPEPNDSRSRSKSKPASILISPGERITSPKSGTPTSPLSPKSPKTTPAKLDTPKRTFPLQAGMPRKTSPVHKAQPSSSKLKKTMLPPKRPLRKEKKQKEVTQTPSIPEVVEPTGSEDGSTTDEKVDSYSSFTELSAFSIYYNEPKPHEEFPEIGSHAMMEETHHRRLTLQEGPSDHTGERKCSHPNIKFPEKVEYTEKPSSQFTVTSHEYERRQKKEYKPRPSAVAYMGSMRSTTLEQPSAYNTPTSAPVSRVTTPSTSRSNSPQRHMSAVVQPTSSKQSPLLERRTSDGKEPATGPTTSQVVDIYAPPPDQPAMGIRHLSSSDKSFDEGREESLEMTVDDYEASSGRPSSIDFPSSCSEMRPQEACLYAIMHEGTALETEVFKMALTDEQVDKVSEIYSLSNSLIQLLLIVPKVQEYLDEGVTTFKILSAVESDGSRSSYIIYSSAGLLSGTSSSASSGVSLSNFDF